MTELSQADLKVLEQTRQRLFQLTNALGAMQAQIASSDPLPSWPSLQSRATIISQTLYTISRHLDVHSDLLNRAVAHPLPQFPGKSQGELLQIMLRKKLEVAPEEWVNKGRQLGQEAQRESLPLEELWNWAPEMVAKSRKHRDLQRQLGMEMEDDEEDDEEEIDVDVEDQKVE